MLRCIYPNILRELSLDCTAVNFKGKFSSQVKGPKSVLEGAKSLNTEFALDRLETLTSHILTEHLVQLQRRHSQFKLQGMINFNGHLRKYKPFTRRCKNTHLTCLIVIKNKQTNKTKQQH